MNSAQGQFGFSLGGCSPQWSWLTMTSLHWVWFAPAYTALCCTFTRSPVQHPCGKALTQPLGALWHCCKCSEPLSLSQRAREAPHEAGDRGPSAEMEQPVCCGGPTALMSVGVSQSGPFHLLCQVLYPGSPLPGCAESSKLSKGQTQKSTAVQREGLCKMRTSDSKSILKENFIIMLW